MLYDCHIDTRDHRPPTPPRPLTRTERKRMTYARAESRVHADADVRADLLVRINDEIDARALFRADAHKAARLAPGALDDQSMTTGQLRAALAALKALPTP